MILPLMIIPSFCIGLRSSDEQRGECDFICLASQQRREVLNLIIVSMASSGLEEKSRDFA